MILERVGIENCLMQLLTETYVQKAKPDPEVFLKAAEMLGVEPADCVVFEDAVAGV